MKKNILLIILLTLLFITACGVSSGFGFRPIEGSGNIITETREVSNFDRVEVCCGMELYLTQGSTESLEIEADDNFMDEIVTRIINQTLIINYRSDGNTNYRPTRSVKLYLAAIDIEAIKISGGGKLNTDSLKSNDFQLELSGGSDAVINELEVDEIDIDISGGGDVIIETAEADRTRLFLSGGSDAEIEELTAKQLIINSSGGGSTTISGTVYEQDIELSGGRSFRGDDLESQEVKFSSSGGGSSSVRVTDTLAVDLSGGSSLRYYGNPDITRQDLSGGSSLKSMGE